MATSENGTEHAADDAESVSATNIVQPYFKWKDVNTEKLIELFKVFHVFMTLPRRRIMIVIRRKVLRNLYQPAWASTVHKCLV